MCENDFPTINDGAAHCDCDSLIIISGPKIDHETKMKVVVRHTDRPSNLSYAVDQGPLWVISRD